MYHKDDKVAKQCRIEIIRRRRQDMTGLAAA